MLGCICLKTQCLELLCSFPDIPVTSGHADFLWIFHTHTFIYLVRITNSNTPLCCIAAELWVTTSTPAEQRGTPPGLRRADQVCGPGVRAGAADDEGVPAPHHSPGVQAGRRHGPPQPDDALVQRGWQGAGLLRVYGKGLGCCTEGCKSSSVCWHSA